ncbi:MAG: SDR family NAD(P)-dependent oxidoreductase [Acidimicrobiia bacterium]
MSAADLFDLTGKVGLVTGANSGLGFGFASGIAKCGGDVVVWGRRADKNEEAAEQLLAMGAGRVHSASVDVSDEAAVVAGMADALEVMGRVDGVVANAGFVTSAPMHEMTTEMYTDMIATAQHGGFWTVREGVKHMVARAEAGDPGGSVIACGSLTTFMGHAGMVHYGAAKGAMAAIMRSLAIDGGQYGIRANTVCAGLFYNGPMMAAPEGALSGMEQLMEAKNPVPRMGKPEDLEGITAYLMSDVSAYHTGDTIVIDGGQSLMTLI